ncbi:MAG: class I SAM-dependent DNA methyltransferase [Methanoregula sp.]|jgi:type I restriction enzyme M protein|uniref:type I restriction-modification system subunit M n=1 Tax=Methanoregula sp. TaxID=2052170 RepID=UPI003C22151B
MSNGDTTWIQNFIWGIADDVLRDDYVRGKYRDVILPMTVIRRIDAVLEPTKPAVLKMKESLDKAKITNQDAALRQASGQAFYNISPFTLRDLKARAKQQQLKADFEAYLDGFSPNVQEILDKFKFRNQILTLVDNDLLGLLIEKFLEPSINLSPYPVFDASGNEKIKGLDNHAMGTIFEELIRKFNEENNEEAGEHFTPRDVIYLMADLIFLPIAESIESGTYLVYDGACGTGGMLTIAEERLKGLAEAHGKEVAIHLYGQEVNPETYAINKADLLLKGEGEEAENIHHASTLSQDAFINRQFDFMLSNPPYGKSWKKDLERMGGKKDLRDPRFTITHGGDAEYSLVTRSSDGQLMFLVNKLSKMKQDTPLGSRIAEVHNGSSLFTGDAGQGESNIRRWIIENDWLEAIIALPLDMFYNTNIATYIWVLSNRKPAHRKGKVQLINATEWYKPLRKNLGKKNCELSEENIRQICSLFLEFKESEQSKIFKNEAFGYWKVTVERPLRLHSQFTTKAVEALRYASGDAEIRAQLYEEFHDALVEDFPKIRKALETRLAEWGTDEEDEDEESSLKKGLPEKIRKKILDEKTWKRDATLVRVAKELRRIIGDKLFTDHNVFRSAVDATLKDAGIKISAADLKTLLKAVSWREETAPPVIAKIHKPGKAKADPLHGLFETKIDGQKAIVEYEPDSDLRDTEQVPLLEDGGIEAFIRREVLPHVPDAWIDESSIKIGYEISFTRYFYKPKLLRTLEEIRADILKVERESEGLLEKILGMGSMT